jgi:hypothetical protein
MSEKLVCRNTQRGRSRSGTKCYRVAWSRQRTSASPRVEKRGTTGRNDRVRPTSRSTFSTADVQELNLFSDYGALRRSANDLHRCWTTSSARSSVSFGMVIGGAFAV